LGNNRLYQNEIFRYSRKNDMQRAQRREKQPGAKISLLSYIEEECKGIVKKN
jgi:hypothetical protein